MLRSGTSCFSCPFRNACCRLTCSHQNVGAPNRNNSSPHRNVTHSCVRIHRAICGCSLGTSRHPDKVVVCICLILLCRAWSKLDVQVVIYV